MGVNPVVPVKNNFLLNHCCAEFILGNIRICISCSRFQCCDGTANRNPPFRFLDIKDPFIHALLIPWLLMFISTYNCYLVLLIWVIRVYHPLKMQWAVLLRILLISEQWIRWWLGTSRQHAITWCNVDSDLWCHMVSLSHTQRLGTHQCMHQFSLTWGSSNLFTVYTTVNVWSPISWFYFDWWVFLI